MWRMSSIPRFGVVPFLNGSRIPSSQEAPMFVKIPLLAFLAAVLIACASRPALGNGGTFVMSRYEATLPNGSGECIFTVELQAETFQLLTVVSKYRGTRIKLRKNGDRPLTLSRWYDRVMY